MPVMLGDDSSGSEAGGIDEDEEEEEGEAGDTGEASLPRGKGGDIGTSLCRPMPNVDEVSEDEAAVASPSRPAAGCGSGRHQWWCRRCRRLR